MFGNNPLILFKIILLRPWYNLSDMVNDTLSTNTFCGLRVEDTRLLRKRVTRSVDPVWGHF